MQLHRLLALHVFFLVQIRRQHRLNLGAVMRHAMLRCDYCTAAGAVGALLACQVRPAQANH
jgi:hypothetical protein